MSDTAIAKLFQIEQQVRRCETATELSFLMVNTSRNLVAYEQATYLDGNELEKLKLFALSDIPLVDRSTPYSAWIEQVASLVEGSEQGTEVHSVKPERWPLELKAELKEFSPPYLLWLPLLIPAKPSERAGVLVMAKSEPWSEKERALLQHLASSYAHAMQLFRQKSAIKTLVKKLLSKKTQLVSLSLLIGLSFVPVRLTVLAPSEVIAKEPNLVMSSIAGAVSEVLVKPGDLVTQGQPLVTMDKTALQGSYDIALRELERAKAELRTAEQAGYVDKKAKSQRVELASQVALKAIELNYIKGKLAQTTIFSKQQGVAVLDDPEKWKGRSVVVGERILSIADPKKIELEIRVAVQDSIPLKKGDEVKFYLDTDPLEPISFKVNYSSFKSSLTPSQTLAYRIIAKRDGLAIAPRIGLRGVAKLYGEEVSLAYYVLRRPITYVRQTLGW
ncbi:efflux RND transporter periplasmic adaptor subunit [Marinomonas balearica]|uniref:CusB/HlyD membrane fusion family barrel-sandwich protein n=1 Tax=Marinomonas balearica TaxID=491947 RepID=A0A4R6MI89_9GAMM|nr:HlyD family efflux transporter periplasmic adaptor subunit [Marinomonas balearica]TDP01126.1 CusB/HlyD membrane fusion family barrel-sandwich protein [Marinomonas balearica]